MRNRALSRGVLWVLLALVVSAVAAHRLAGPDVEGTRDACRANRASVLRAVGHWSTQPKPGRSNGPCRSLSVLVPGELAAIPTCPAAGDVYSRGYVYASEYWNRAAIQCPVHGMFGMGDYPEGDARETQEPFRFSVGGVQPGWARSRYNDALGPPRVGRETLHYDSGVEVGFPGYLWSEGEPAGYWVHGKTLEFKGRTVAAPGDPLQETVRKILALDKSLHEVSQDPRGRPSVWIGFSGDGGFSVGLKGDGLGRVAGCALALW